MNRSLIARRGFTLLEVLVAVALTATVLVISYGVLMDALDTHESAQRAAQAANRQTACFDLLAVDLGGAVLAPPGNDQIDNATWLVEVRSGDFKALEFPTARSLMSFSDPAELGLVRVRYELSGDAAGSEGRTLVRTVFSEGSIQPSRTVCGGIEKIEVQVLTGGVWRPLASAAMWQSGPAALRLVVRWAGRAQPASRTFLLGGPAA
jgi:type II secretion system protein J